MYTYPNSNIYPYSNTFWKTKQKQQTNQTKPNTFHSHLNLASAISDHIFYSYANNNFLHLTALGKPCSHQQHWTKP